MLFGEALVKLQTNDEVVGIRYNVDDEDIIIKIESDDLLFNSYLYYEIGCKRVQYTPSMFHLLSDEWRLIYKEKDKSAYSSDEEIVMSCANIKQLTSDIKDVKLKKKICNEVSKITKATLKLTKEGKDA